MGPRSYLNNGQDSDKLALIFAAPALCSVLVPPGGGITVKTALKVIGVVVVVLIVAALALPFLINVNSFRPQIESRIRLPADQTVSSLSPLELLDQYWLASHAEDVEMLQRMAKEIIEEES